ncbi:uncharacterized protein LOC126892767 [Diabrotica virgifera virgifera]|uniref:Uncharacterized protein n=1 Tax=Diabrotica virgifera virgifera TaxID=50390 RepID=A0ABM5L7I9_DIAVI|nr:uncharacterized protein LOC126892767 [Diabrotica virgifera virgifera]
MATSNEVVVVDDLKDLVRLRGTNKQKLTLLEKFITKTKDKGDFDIQDVQFRYDNHINLLNDFDIVQTEIEKKCSEGQLPEHYSEREEFENRFYAAQAYLKTILRPVAVNSNNVQYGQLGQSSEFKAVSDPLQNVLLPRIKLQTFSGEFQFWVSFKNSFNATIANNASLSDGQKFHFLKASLQGYAASCIEGLESVDQPFQKAWDLLCDRFDKKQFLIDSHFKSLLNLTMMQKDNYNYASFRNMLDEISKHLTSLEGIDVPKEKLYDSFMIHILINKFQKNTIREWKETKVANDLPTLEHFINFLKNKTDILQSLDESQTAKSQSSSSNKYHNRSNNLVHFAVKNRCNFCRKEHSIYKCPTFKALSVEERFREVRKLKLCENCLLSGHDKRNCKFGPCPVCKTHKHNTLLHKDYAEVSIRDTNHQVSSPSTFDHRNDGVEQQISINFAKNESQVLLATVMCNIKDQDGKFTTQSTSSLAIN